jgi:hypothetical protein
MEEGLLFGHLIGAFALVAGAAIADALQRSASGDHRAHGLAPG